MILKNTELIENVEGACVFAFQNRIIIFEYEKVNLLILDDSLTLISSIILKSPLLKLRIASLLDSGALECIDVFNNKCPIPIMGSLSDYKSYNERLYRYANNFRYPMPI